MLLSLAKFNGCSVDRLLWASALASKLRQLCLYTKTVSLQFGGVEIEIVPWTFIMSTSVSYMSISVRTEKRNLKSSTFIWYRMSPNIFLYQTTYVPNATGLYWQNCLAVISLKSFEIFLLKTFNVPMRKACINLHNVQICIPPFIDTFLDSLFEKFSNQNIGRFRYWYKSNKMQIVFPARKFRCYDNVE